MRRRSKMTRYNPARAKALRADLAKHPNPVFGEMLKDNPMSDGDLVDFALGMAHSYFTGTLLESFKTTERFNLELVSRRTLLATVSLFGKTAVFDEDGSVTIGPAWTDDPNTHIAAVQALVDVGFSVVKAQSLLASPPPQGRMAEPIRTHLPVVH